jgi:tetrahydromethanopterin S-methyltransferase subunit E
MAFTNRYPYDSDQKEYGQKSMYAQVSYAAHIGGGVTGLLLGQVLLRNVKILRWELILQSISLVVYVIIFVACTVTVVLVSHDKEALFKCSKT